MGQLQAPLTMIHSSILSQRHVQQNMLWIANKTETIDLTYYILTYLLGNNSQYCSADLKGPHLPS